MMRKTLLALAAATVLLPAAASARNISMCDVRSDYNLRIEPDALVWTRDSGDTRLIEMRRGELTIDGQRQSLSRADRERIVEIEATVRELVPQVKDIAIDAVDIAFTALEHVGRLMGSEGNLVRRAEEMATLRIAAERKIDDAFTHNAWSDADFEKVVGDTVESLVPIVVSDIAAAAVRVALSGDEKGAKELEERAERMEATLEREVESRADALETRAKALCPLVADLDRVDEALELRIAGNRRIDFLRLQ